MTDSSSTTDNALLPETPEKILKCMVEKDGNSIWVRVLFEFDTGDGKGMQWQSGRSIGNSVDKIKQHFIDKGYEIIPFNDSVLSKPRPAI